MVSRSVSHEPLRVEDPHLKFHGPRDNLVLATARLQRRDPTRLLVPVLRARAPTLADLDYTPAPLPAAASR
ncbi:MAG: hypothetical protein ACR2FV_01870 [Ornithinimicrobium sp.]|uniref:hypothetical protein n=1 Tax=Ornithinimicrobium sp. TaxID=1977084 RepID=UPI003D9B51EA